MVVRNIYLADDDNDDIELFQEALQDVCNACSLTSSKNGLELLRKLEGLQNSLPEVLFLDINMPLVNGLECLEKIKSEESLKNITVIIFTTSTSAATIERAYKLGASLFVEKPCDYNKLKELIRNIMKMDLAQFAPNCITGFVYKIA